MSLRNTLERFLLHSSASSEGLQPYGTDFPALYWTNAGFPKTPNPRQMQRLSSHHLNLTRNLLTQCLNGQLPASPVLKEEAHCDWGWPDMDDRKARLRLQAEWPGVEPDLLHKAVSQGCGLASIQGLDEDALGAEALAAFRWGRHWGVSVAYPAKTKFGLKRGRLRQSLFRVPPQDPFLGVSQDYRPDALDVALSTPDRLRASLRGLSWGAQGRAFESCLMAVSDSPRYFRLRFFNQFLNAFWGSRRSKARAFYFKDSRRARSSSYFPNQGLVSAKQVFSDSRERGVAFDCDSGQLVTWMAGHPRYFKVPFLTR